MYFNRLILIYSQWYVCMHIAQEDPFKKGQKAFSERLFQVV